MVLLIMVYLLCVCGAHSSLATAPLLANPGAEEGEGAGLEQGRRFSRQLDTEEAGLEQGRRVGRQLDTNKSFQRFLLGPQASGEVGRLAVSNPHQASPFRPTLPEPQSSGQFLTPGFAQASNTVFAGVVPQTHQLQQQQQPLQQLPPAFLQGFPRAEVQTEQFLFPASDGSIHSQFTSSNPSPHAAPHLQQRQLLPGLVLVQQPQPQPVFLQLHQANQPSTSEDQLPKFRRQSVTSAPTTLEPETEETELPTGEEDLFTAAPALSSEESALTTQSPRSRSRVRGSKQFVVDQSALALEEGLRQTARSRFVARKRTGLGEKTLEQQRTRIAEPVGLTNKSVDVEPNTASVRRIQQNSTSDKSELFELFENNLKECNEKSEFYERRIEELENRTRLHLDYANQKKLEIQELLNVIETLQNNTYIIELKVLNFENKINNISRELELREAKLNGSKTKEERKSVDLLLDEKDKAINSHLEMLESERVEVKTLQTRVTLLEQEQSVCQQDSQHALKDKETAEAEKQNLLAIIQKLAEIGNPNFSLKENSRNPKVENSFDHSLLMNSTLEKFGIDLEAITSLLKLGRDGSHQIGVNTENEESVVNSEPVESVTNSETVENVTHSETVESVTHFETLESATNSETVESVTNSETVESVTNSETVESVTNSEDVESANTPIVEILATEVLENATPSIVENHSEAIVETTELPNKQEESENGILITNEVESSETTTVASKPTEIGEVQLNSDSILKDGINEETDSTHENEIRNERQSINYRYYPDNRLAEESPTFSNLKEDLIEEKSPFVQTESGDVSVEETSHTDVKTSEESVATAPEESGTTATEESGTTAPEESVATTPEESGTTVPEAPEPIVNDGIEVEAESSASADQESRSERHSSVELSEQEPTQEIIFKDGLREEMESSLLDAIRKERQSGGLDVKLQEVESATSGIDQPKEQEAENTEAQENNHSILVEEQTLSDDRNTKNEFTSASAHTEPVRSESLEGIREEDPASLELGQAVDPASLELGQAVDPAPLELGQAVDPAPLELGQVVDPAPVELGQEADPILKDQGASQYDSKRPARHESDQTNHEGAINQEMDFSSLELESYRVERNDGSLESDFLDIQLPTKEFLGPIAE